MVGRLRGCLIKPEEELLACYYRLSMAWTPTLEAISIGIVKGHTKASRGLDRPQKTPPRRCPFAWPENCAACSAGGGRGPVVLRCGIGRTVRSLEFGVLMV